MSHGSGGRNTEFKVLAGPVPSRGSEGESSPCRPPGFWPLLAIPGFLQLRRSKLLLPPHRALTHVSSVSVSKPPSYHSSQ